MTRRNRDRGRHDDVEEKEKKPAPRWKRVHRLYRAYRKHIESQEDVPMSMKTWARAVSPFLGDEGDQTVNEWLEVKNAGR